MDFVQFVLVSLIHPTRTPDRAESRSKRSCSGRVGGVADRDRRGGRDEEGLRLDEHVEFPRGGARVQLSLGDAMRTRLADRFNANRGVYLPQRMLELGPFQPPDPRTISRSQNLP